MMSTPLRFFRRVTSIALVVPLTLAIFAALLLVAQSTYENMRFAHATRQILDLVSLAHDTASHQADFAAQPGQDVLAALTRAGQITAQEDSGTAKLVNPWQGALHGATSGPSVLRVDTVLPVRDCRRLALFFAQIAAETGLLSMEAKGDGGAWAAFYKGGNAAELDAGTVEKACGQKPEAVLALAFRLR